MTRLTLAFARSRSLIGILLALIVLAGFFLLQGSFQPDIKISNKEINLIDRVLESETLIGRERFYDGGAFSLLAGQTGTYFLVFSDLDVYPPLTSAKEISVNYTIDGDFHSDKLEVVGGSYRSLGVNATKGQTISGDFVVTGTHTNGEIDLTIRAVRCTQTLSFSFTAVNSGLANGFAVVQLLVDGESVWVNQYHIDAGREMQDSGMISISDFYSTSSSPENRCTENHIFELSLSHQTTIGTR